MDWKQTGMDWKQPYKYKPILMMPKLTQEVPKIRKPMEKKKKVLPEPVGRKFRF